MNRRTIKKSNYTILYILLLIMPILVTSCAKNNQPNDDTLNYKPSEVRAYSNMTLKRLYQAFPTKTKKAEKYKKSKTNNKRNQILLTALKQGDLGTLVTICHDEPTKLNKAYVYACGWNFRYDKVNVENYAVCLIYYRDIMSKKEKEHLPKLMLSIMDACIVDPTAESYHNDNSNIDYFYDNDLDIWTSQLMQQQMHR